LQPFEKEPATQVVKNIRRATRRLFSAEDKIRIVLEGFRGEESIAELCRHEGESCSRTQILYKNFCRPLTFMHRIRAVIFQIKAKALPGGQRKRLFERRSRRTKYQGPRAVSRPNH
jgi:hypothetical protein